MRRVGNVLLTVECDRCGTRSNVSFTNEEWENSVSLPHDEVNSDFLVEVVCSECGNRDNVSLLY